MLYVLVAGAVCLFLLDTTCRLWPQVKEILVFFSNLIAVFCTHTLMHIMIHTAGYRFCAEFGPRVALFLGVATIATYYLLLVRLMQLISGINQVISSYIVLICF